MARREEQDNGNWKKAAGIIGLGAAGLAAAYGLYALFNKEERPVPAPAQVYPRSEPSQKVPLNTFVECSICLDKIEYENDCVFLPCCHVFHKDCISQWTKIRPTCSMCRTEISAADLRTITSSTPV